MKCKRSINTSFKPVSDYELMITINGITGSISINHDNESFVVD